MKKLGALGLAVLLSVGSSFAGVLIFNPDGVVDPNALTNLVGGDGITVTGSGQVRTNAVDGTVIRADGSVPWTGPDDHDGQSQTNVNVLTVTNVYSFGPMAVRTTNPEGDFCAHSPAGSNVFVCIRTGDDGEDAWLMLSETASLGLIFEYDGAANVGYIGMNNGFVNSGAWSRRIRMSRTGTEVSFPVGYVGFNTNSPVAWVDIWGDLKLSNGVSVSEFSIDGTLAGNSDDVVPTEKAVKTYVDASGGGTEYATNVTHIGPNTVVVTNYTSAGVSNAIADIVAKGLRGTVWFDPDTAYVWGAKGIDVSDNITIEGNGARIDTTGQAQTDAAIDITGTNVTIRNLTIVSDRNGGTAFNQLDFAAGADQCLIENVWFETSDNHCVEFASGAQDNLILNCYFADAHRGIRDLDGNNTYRGNLMVGMDDLTIVAGGSGTRVIGNTIRNCSDQAIYVSAESIVADNLIDTPGQNGISVNGINCVVNGNIILDSGTIGIAVNSDFATITGNMIHESANTYADIKLNNADGCTVSGNICDSVAGKSEQGIYVDNGDNNIIVGNSLNGHDTAGIQIDSDCDNNTIGENNLEGEAVAKIIDNSSTTHYGVEAQDDGLLYKGSDILEIGAKVAITNLSTATWSPSASDMYGMLWVNDYTNTIDITLTNLVAGMSWTIVNSTNAVTIIMDSPGDFNWILNDGSALDNGDAADSSGAVDDKAGCVVIDSSTIMIISEQNAFTDGGTD